MGNKLGIVVSTERQEIRRMTEKTLAMRRYQSITLNGVQHKAVVIRGDILLSNIPVMDFISRMSGLKPTRRVAPRTAPWITLCLTTPHSLARFW